MRFCTEVLQLPEFTPRVRDTEAWKNILQEHLRILLENNWLQ